RIRADIEAIGVERGFQSRDLRFGAVDLGLVHVLEQARDHERGEHRQDGADHHQLDQGEAALTFLRPSEAHALPHSGMSLMLKIASRIEITIVPTTRPITRIMAGSNSATMFLMAWRVSRS